MFIQNLHKQPKVQKPKIIIITSTASASTIFVAYFTTPAAAGGLQLLV